MVAKLRDKQERFCMEYLVDSNATQAAIRAGYSEKSAGAIGHENLQKPEILARIKEIQAEYVERLFLNKDFVMKGLTEVYQKSVQATPVMQWDYKAREMVETGEYTFDSRGANRALELLGKQIGMFEGNKETKPDPITIVIKRGDKDA